MVPLLGPCWHLMFGDAISYAGWRVPVPKGFYVRKSQKGPTMWKQSLGIPLFDVSYGHISLYSVGPAQQPFTCDRDYSRFEKGVTQEATQSGYQLLAKRTASVGKSSGYCLEFARAGVEPRSLVRCAIENSVVVLFLRRRSSIYSRRLHDPARDVFGKDCGRGSYHYDETIELARTYGGFGLHSTRILPAYSFGHILGN